MEMEFDPGKCVTTEKVRSRMYSSINGFGSFVYISLGRHVRGDWGDLSEEDKALNDEAVKNGGRIFSSYNFGNEKIWIITEADRSATTILFPDEY